MTRRAAPWLPWLLLAAAGCAHAPAPSPLTPPDADLLARAEEAQRRLASELAALGASAAEPDCARVCTLRANICALADKICAVAARYPSDPATRSRCDDGRARCARAKLDAAARCSCAQ
jgi:hypothetical protein